ncbi:MAG: prepilin-type N-terminal cleavage/methylation domain-containing protein, partial [Kiritimatiellaceae bacterium]|nr:prepilin-type N-terminal cleavage/methylation domain-containing protein [Kiritimatiellaceae bacterium]
MIRRQKAKRGFTLLEIIVSISLLTLIALMLSRVFNESSKTMHRETYTIALDKTARLLLDYMEQDIGQALIRTNVAFRISDSAHNGSLYFISPAARKHHDNFPRDSAPIRITSQPSDSGEHPEWNRFILAESPDRSSGSSKMSRANLINHSAYYFTNNTQTMVDFETAEDAVYQAKYTKPAGTGLEDHAVLTFLNITVNADPTWNYNNLDGPPDPDNMPRFVDISLGLVSAREI